MKQVMFEALFDKMELDLQQSSGLLWGCAGHFGVDVCSVASARDVKSGKSTQIYEVEISGQY